MKTKNYMSIFVVVCLFFNPHYLAAEEPYGRHIPGDIAEQMPLSTRAQVGEIKPVAGEVVVVDNNGFIEKCREPNSRFVVGVVSTKPAHTLRSMIKEGVPVALGGIVPCRVTSENGFIKPGDLLVSASKPGYAMKALPPLAPGTVIGKALDTQEAENDNVLVLMMLR